MTTLELTTKIFKRLTETSTALWPSQQERWTVAAEVAVACPRKRGPGQWTVERAMEAMSNPGEPTSRRHLYVVQRSDDHVYGPESMDMANAVAKALNDVEAAANQVEPHID